MKTLRYLLIAMAMASALGMSAQSFVQRQEVQMAGDIVVSSPGQLQSSGSLLQSKRTITPVAVQSPRSAMMGGGSTMASPFKTLTTRNKRSGGMSGGGFSGGSAAGGLMSSGSRYSSAGNGGGSVGGASFSDGPRKIGGGNSGGGDPGPPDPDDPWATPIGNAVIPLMLLACAYVLLRVYRRKRSV